MSDYLWYLNAGKQESSAFYHSVFTDSELDDIIALVPDSSLTTGTVENSNLDYQGRDSDICFLKSSDMENQWVFRRMVDVIQNANSQFWDFDLTAIQNIQYTVYRKDQFYTKHIDMLYNSPPEGCRKLSFTVQLSDPEDYDGGDLLVYSGSEPWTAPRDRGTITFFPSYILHEVTPVTRGERRSLVGWVMGPRFR